MGFLKKLVKALEIKIDIYEQPTMSTSGKLDSHAKPTQEEIKRMEERTWKGKQ